jgi:hypothetical protein
VWGAPAARLVEDDLTDDGYEEDDDNLDLDDHGADIDVIDDANDEDDDGALLVDDDDPDAVDTTPTPIPRMLERDPTIDSGRHARIDVDEPPQPRTAFRLPLEDPDRPPENYPVKADTRSGLYWGPDNNAYDEAHAEIWFASEELARANGFTPAGD